MTVAGTTSNSRLYHAWVSANHSGWDNAEYIAFTANDTDWGTGDFYLNSAHHYTAPLNYGATNSSGAYLFSPSNATNNTASNNNTMSGSYNGTNRDVLKKNQDFYIYTGGTSSAAGGSVDATCYYVNGSSFNGSSAIASSSITINSSDSGAHEQYGGAVEGTKVSMTATPKTGYKFDGYYDAATGGNLISSSASYNYYVFGTKSVYARFSLKTYTITYNKGANGTGTVASTTKTHGTNATLSSNTFTRTGYAFEKWTTASNGTGSSFSDGQSVKNLAQGGNNITLYAQWKSNAKVYTVQYHANGGMGTTKPSTHTVGSSSSLTANGFTRDGYVFSGWNTMENGSGNQYGDAAQVIDLATKNNAVVKLYAQWREKTEAEYLKTCTLYPSYMNLTVTDGSGKIMALPTGDGTAVRQLTAGEQMVSTALYKNSKGEYWYQIRANRDSKVGYVFAGDATSRGIADRTVSFGVWLNNTSVLRGYACDILGSVSARYNILYKVTGVLNDSDPKTEAQTQTITTGFEDVKGTDLNKKLAFAPLSRGKGTLNLTAMLRSAYSTDGKTLLWEEYTTDEYPLDFRIIGVYNVLFDENTTDDVKKMPNTQNKTDETDLQLPANVPTRTGYTFRGWAKDEDAEKPDYIASDYLREDTDTGNLTLYAVWDGPNEYTITFDANGGTGGPGTATATHGKKFYYPQNNPTLAGCTFLGWSKTQDVDGNAADAEDYLLKQPVQFTEDTTLYAVWKHGTVTITYYHNDGSGQTTVESILASKVHTLPGTDWITRDGYVLLGYAETAGATEPAYLPSGEITIGANKILHLVWKPEIWMVTYNANGGSGAPEAQEKRKNVDLVLSSQIPVRMNDEFLGWSDSPDSKDVLRERKKKNDLVSLL